jgi:hypothetical protein
MTLVLDGLFVLLVLYVVTQLFFPILWPSDFEVNWLFKKGSRAERKIARVNKANRERLNAVDDALVEADKKIKEAKDLKQSTKK